MIPNVVVPGAGFLEIDLARVVRQAGGNFSVGSVRVKYYGKILQMGAQVLVQDLDRGLQLDEQFSYASYSYVNRLEGLWWRPNAQAQMSIVMKNVSDEPLEVRGRINGPDRGGRPEGELSRFRLAPHEQRIVSFHGDGGGRLRAGDTAGGVSLEFDGPYGALLARLLVEHARSGYSASLALSPTTGARTSSYHGGGLRRSSGEVPLLPVLLARNLGDTSAIVTGRLVFNRADGTVDRIELPQKTLEAGETALMDARTAWGIVQEQASDEGIGVEFEYTSAPGSVLMSAGLVSGDRNLVFRVPLIDPETPKSSTGGYPWFADDARTTTVFLKNTTTTTMIYLLQVSFDGGVYAPGIKKIEPGQTLAIDVRQLRDAQVPDAFGHTIPMHAQSGQVSWTVKMTTPHAMIGRAEHTDHEHGVSASYACLNCCPPKTHSVWTEDYPSQLPIGSTVGLLVMAEDEDCYQNISAAYSMPWPYLNDWYFANTGIATSYSDSTVYGVSGGETTFYVDFPGVEYHVEGTEYGWYCALTQPPINISGPVQVPPAYPVNFRKTGTTYFNGFSNMHPLPAIFDYYTWDSSSGNRSHLAACEIWEDLDYGTWSAPPFYGQPSNNQLKMADATAQSFEDIHGTQGPLLMDNGQPIAGSGPLTQRYKYRCTTIQNNALLDITGPDVGPHSVTRQTTVNGSNWFFSISKHGSSASCQLRTSSTAGWCQ